MAWLKMMEESGQSKLLKSIDEEAFKLLQDETRRKIISLLRDNEQTVRKIASELDLTTQDIYHHIKKLQDSGFVEVSKERRSGHLIESYYTATADTFVYHADEIVEKSVQSSIHILNGLSEMGIKVDVSEKNANRLSRLHERQPGLSNASSAAKEICSSCSFSGYFMKFGPMNPLLLNRILQYNRIVNMTDKEFEESLKLTRELRQFLLSIRIQEP